MAFTAAQLADINNSTMAFWLNRRQKSANQNVSNKPMLAEFEKRAKERVTGGNGEIVVKVKAGQGGLTLQGYTGDDQVNYGNPVGLRNARYLWKEHHMGMVITHTELKMDGIEVIESNGTETTRDVPEGELIKLNDLYEEKLDMMGEDFDFAFDRLLHADGTADPKSIAGIMSLLTEAPAAGTTGGLSRVLNPWWRNRAATAANGTAGGQGAITSAPTNGGTLITFLQGEKRRRTRYAGSGANVVYYAGSDWIAAYENEIRANGSYSQTGFRGAQDGAMGGLKFDGDPVVWDPTLDDLGLTKRAIAIDHKQIMLEYMRGQRLKKHQPSRPYDRYVMYNGMTTTCALIAKQLNTSGIYDIA
ncbi:MULTISPECIES: phage major capsid protein [Paracoccus]|uniref:phage major capsid protein n=1 Tax=Paracoccus TaxID=265 RepID=UPI00086E9D41|nr:MULTISPECIES: phage major capsid protein [Paracoccus]ODT60961.1 MAG: hypothetical protein ABS73_03745 [Paracoccus sp. SCN 68-21]